MSDLYSFVDCYSDHYSRVVRALELAGASRASAEDVAQDAFSIALRNWRRIAKGSNPPGYVYRVAFRLWQRANRRELPTNDIDVEMNVTTDTSDLRIMLQEAIAQLPPRRRSVAVLVLVLGFRAAEVAELLHISDATARKHVEEARRDLKRWLSDPD